MHFMQIHIVKLFSDHVCKHMKFTCQSHSERTLFMNIMRCHQLDDASPPLADDLLFNKSFLNRGKTFCYDRLTNYHMVGLPVK